MPYNPVTNKKSRKWYNRPYREWNLNEIDHQAQKVYAMEYMFFEKERLVRHFKDTKDIYEYVERVISKPRFKKLFGVYKLDENSIYRRKSKFSTKTYAYIHDSNYIEIEFSQIYAPKYVALHEIAHCICPSTIGHGPLFCRVYADLVEIEYGKDEKKRFLALMDTCGIKYSI